MINILKLREMQKKNDENKLDKNETAETSGKSLPSEPIDGFTEFEIVPDEIPAEKAAENVIEKTEEVIEPEEKTTDVPAEKNESISEKDKAEKLRELLLQQVLNDPSLVFSADDNIPDEKELENPELYDLSNEILPDKPDILREELLKQVMEDTSLNLNEGEEIPDEKELEKPELYNLPADIAEAPEKPVIVPQAPQKPMIVIKKPMFKIEPKSEEPAPEAKTEKVAGPEKEISEPTKPILEEKKEKPAIAKPEAKEIPVPVKPVQAEQSKLEAKKELVNKIVSGQKDETFVDLIQIVEFKLANESYGTEILKIQEIIRKPDITRVPNAPVFIEGVINLRGSVIPVINIRRKINLPENTDTENTRIIVYELEDTRVGFMVDEVKEVLRIPKDRLTPPPDFSTGISTEYITSIAKMEEYLIILVDMDRLLLEGMKF